MIENNKKVCRNTESRSVYPIIPDATFIGPPDLRPDRGLYLPVKKTVAGGFAKETYQQAALWWLQFGLQVIPIRPGTKKPAVTWANWLDDLSHFK